MGTAAAATGAVLIFLKPNTSFAAGDTITADIANNHGHAFSIPLATLLANGPTTYSIQGSSGHPHSIAITDEILDALEAGQNVDIASSKDAGHSHGVLLQLV